MTASAPASSKSWAKDRCAALGQVLRSMPQWTSAITTSAAQAASSMLSTTRDGGRADAIPGESGPVGKLRGTIMDTPTKATLAGPFDVENPVAVGLDIG